MPVEGAVRYFHADRPTWRGEKGRGRPTSRSFSTLLFPDLMVSFISSRYSRKGIIYFLDRPVFQPYEI